MFYWAPKPITIAHGLEAINSKHDESTKNQSIIFGFVCLFWCNNVEKNHIQGPSQLLTKFWEWIQDHNRLCCMELWNMGEKEIDRQHRTNYACSCKNAWEQKCFQQKPSKNIFDSTNKILNSRNQSWYVWYTPLMYYSFLSSVYVGLNLAYFVALKPVGYVETLCGGCNNYCFGLPDVKYSIIPKGRRVWFIGGPKHANHWHR